LLLIVCELERWIELLTISQVLELPPFAEAAARLVAGAEHLDNEVLWVHCSEMPEAGRLFKGGELLLTQGRGIGRSVQQQIKWIDDLASASVSGVAIETGVLWAEIPAPVVAHAIQRSVPLIALSHPAYFMDMTRSVHASIISSHYDALLHAQELGRRLSRLAMAGASLQAAVDELASVMSHPLVLTDRAHQVEVYAPRNASTLGRIKNWDAHARQGHDYSGIHATPSRADAGELSCLYQPIIYQGDLWGCLHVLVDDMAPDELTLMAMDRAVMSIGLAYAVAEGERRHDDGARSILIQDLLSSTGAAPEDVLAKAKVFGADLSGKLRVFMMQPQEDANEKSEGASSPSTRRLRAALHTIASAAGRSLTPKALIGYSGTRVVGIASDADSLERLESIRCGGGINIVTGVSSVADLTTLVRAGREAGDTVQYAVQSGSQPGVYYADRLGLERLLLKLDESSLLVEHIERELGPVLDHDATSSSPLLPTLEMYLLNLSKKTHVAKTLNIERRTLYHRLERLRTLLGPDFDHPDRQLSLKIALRGLAFRQKRTR
jgi:purine catabolism regulator